MKTLPLIVLFVACCATGTSWAAEPAQNPRVAAKTATPAAESAAPNDDEDSQVEDNVQGEEEQSGAGKPQGAGQKTGEGKPSEGKPSEDKPSAADKASPQRFVPSEEVRADFDVSFPIDI